MSLPADFIEKLKFVHPKDIIDLVQTNNYPKIKTRWMLKNELRPVDLYCYLGSRFGAPNGIQNFLRSDDSNNLIHWEWFLDYDNNTFVIFQGMNFRTEIWISGIQASDSEKSEFINQIKSHYAQFGSEMGKIRKTLERWVEFVNPYQRLRRAISSLMEEIKSMNLDTEQDQVPDFPNLSSPDVFVAQWKVQSEKYSRAAGLCFGVRSMLPVMAESFINLLLYILMKPEIRKNERLRESAVRQPIDIRIISLSNNCFGFKHQIDFSNEVCRRFHTLMNERNDLLHGNVAIDKLRFNEIYFHGKIPIFFEYSSMWERSLGIMHKSVGIDKVASELAVVDDLVQYLLACLDDKIRKGVVMISEKFILGERCGGGGLGVLFSDFLIDMIDMPADSGNCPPKTNPAED